MLFLEVLNRQKKWAFIEYDRVINLVVSEEEVIKRLTSRGRADDKPEIIKNIKSVSSKDATPLLSYYKDDIINIKAEEIHQKI